MKMVTNGYKHLEDLYFLISREVNKPTQISYLTKG